MRHLPLALALLLLASGCTRVTYPPDRSGGAIAPTSPSPPAAVATRVEFRVTGNPSSVRVRISDPQDGLTQLVTTLPYTASFRTTETAWFVSLDVTPISYSLLTTFPFLSAQILIDGNVFREASSNEFILNTISVSGTWRRDP